MLREIVVEAIILVALSFVAYLVGWRKVRLIDRPIIDEDDYIIAPPRRKTKRVKHARELHGKFVRRNRCMEVESESLIVLPSISFNWIVGIIVAGVMAFMLFKNHFYGIAQMFVAPSDHDMFWDYYFAFMGIVGLCAFIAAWIAECVIPNAAKSHAVEIANARMRKGRTARFAQDLSLDEIAIAAKWAAEEEIAEKRAAWNRRKNQKTLKAEIIDFPRLPMAANGR